MKSAFVGILAGLMMTGCGEMSEPIALPEWVVPGVAPPRHFVAGAARVDMTPPVGYPTGGHGPSGAVSRGYWGRLFARAFYLEDTGGRKLVMVSVESFAIPIALHFDVARRVAGLGIHREEIVLAATHTHQGPGNYLSASAYNMFGSKKPGFDGPLFSFLAERIAAAIRQARDDARKGGEASLALYSGHVGDLLRNRAPEPFLLNPDRDVIMRTLAADNTDGPAVECRHRGPDEDGIEAEPDGGWDPGQRCPRLRALDRAITVLEIRRSRGGKSKPVGLLVFLAVHPTVLHHDTPFYSSDFTGVAVRSLELELARGENCPLPVVGFFNGAEGDVTARRRQRDLRDVLRLAGEMKDDVRRVLANGRRGWTFDGNLSVRFIEADTSCQRECSGPGSGSVVSIARRPLMGAAGIGGGEGDRTALYDLGWKEGSRTEPRSGQGPKIGALDASLFPGLNLTELLAPRDSWPRRLPLTWARIGSFSIVTLPVEMTTAMAFALRSALGKPHGEMELVGLANEYASYATSPYEYAAQNYEGGSTLWGPHEGAYLICFLRKLEATPPAALPSRVLPSSFEPGTLPAKPFGPEFCGDRREAPDEELDAVLLDVARRPLRSLPWFEWEESLANRSDDFSTLEAPSKSGYVAESPKVEIQIESGGQWEPYSVEMVPPGDTGVVVGSPFAVLGTGPQNDLGFGLLTMLIDAHEVRLPIDCGGKEVKRPCVCDEVTSLVSPERPLRRRWAALWITPRFADLSRHRFRFYVLTRSQGVRFSTAFTVNPSDSTLPSIRRIGEELPPSPCNVASPKWRPRG